MLPGLGRFPMEGFAPEARRIYRERKTRQHILQAAICQQKYDMKFWKLTNNITMTGRLGMWSSPSSSIGNDAAAATKAGNITKPCLWNKKPSMTWMLFLSGFFSVHFHTFTLYIFGNSVLRRLKIVYTTSMFANARKAFVRACKVGFCLREGADSWKHTVVYQTLALATTVGQEDVRYPWVVINSFVEYTVVAEQIIQTLSKIVQSAPICGLEEGRRRTRLGRAIGEP
jgi:hypothetical protein